MTDLKMSCIRTSKIHRAKVICPCFGTRPKQSLADARDTIFDAVWELHQDALARARARFKLRGGCLTEWDLAYPMTLCNALDPATDTAQNDDQDIDED